MEKLIRLGDIVTYNKGYAFKSTEYCDEGVMVVRISDFTTESVSIDNAVFIDERDEFQKYRLNEGDILIQTVGSWANNPKSIVGKIIRVPKECKNAYLNQNIVRIIAKEGIDNSYLYYALKANKFSEYCVIRGQGAANQASITLNTVFRFKLKLPDYDSQKLISNIISQYDEQIKINSRKIKILETLSLEIYKEWFVRFRFPGYENVEHVAGVPKTWKLTKLGEIIDIDRGLSYTSEEIDCDDGTDLVNLKNIQSFGGYRLDGTKKYSGNYKNSHIVKTGDLIMGITDMTQDRRTVGSVALIPIIHNTSVISADLIKITSHISNYYLYAMFRYGNVSKYISQFANGANVLHLRPQVVNKIKVYLPPLKLIEAFSELFKPIVDEINLLNEMNKNLIKQRDLLIPRLMSGNLKVV